MSLDKQNRLTKVNRLSDAASYDRVFGDARRSRDHLFTVLCSDNDEAPPRLGLAISKKFCRLATARNRIKRVVRESFREHKSELQGLDIVVMNRGPAGIAPNEELFRSLEEHWRRCSSGTNRRTGTEADG